MQALRSTLRIISAPHERRSAQILPWTILPLYSTTGTSETAIHGTAAAASTTQKAAVCTVSARIPTVSALKFAVIIPRGKCRALTVPHTALLPQLWLTPQNWLNN